ncbi:Uncharacterised protein [Mannheimia haemolytica]|uniref:Uncharacterized protein n=1 Tax=Mannheimia haemolytica TaxID=75985 RepID=A0A378N0G3_MANHA|nr:Uncharacterised protein [Mannheimia haemolytica]
MNNHYIIGYVGDNLERYQYNKSQLKSIVLMHEEIKNIVDKGILNKVKKPMWFIFFPTSILLFYSNGKIQFIIIRNNAISYNVDSILQY